MKLTGAVFLFFLIASLPVFLLLQSREQIDLFGNIGQLTGLVFAAASFLNAWDIAKNRLIQKVAILIAGGMLIWAIGQLMVTYSELLLHRSPYGTVSSIFFVIGNSMCLTALIELSRHALKTGNRAVLVRTLQLILVTALILLTFLVLGDWHFLTDPERDSFYKILDLLYPMFDVCIVGLTVLLLRSAHLRNEMLAFKGYACFCLAFLAIGFADVVGIDTDFEKMVYRLTDTIYFSAYFLIALSGHFLARTSRKLAIQEKSLTQ